MLGGWTEMGCGRAGGTMWTQKFGSAGGRSLKAPDKLPAPEPEVAPEPEDDSGRPLKPGQSRVPDEAPPSEGELEDEEEDK